MQKKSFLTYENIILIALMCLAVFSRLIKHEWNFTAVFAASFAFAVMFPKARVKSLILMFGSMLVSDIVIGFHNTMAFVYLGFALSLLPVYFAQKNVTRFAALLFGSLVFFLISNFGVWFSGNLYTHDLNGFVNCLAMGIPFYKNQFMADMLLTPSLISMIIIAKNNFATAAYCSNRSEI